MMKSHIVQETRRRSFKRASLSLVQKKGGVATREECYMDATEGPAREKKTTTRSATKKAKQLRSEERGRTPNRGDRARPE